ncbi:hypothetical protein [Streptomyces sp. bgisy100]|uniref:hypothetical protein n=1 Tax=Streptomyces sp. bgisy100 TaxID=3413783 RepID=UPI003D703699
MHIDVYGEEAARRMPPAGQWGCLEFQNAEGRRILRIPLVEWLPESVSPGARPEKGSDLLQLTGASALVKALGIPLETARRLDDPLLSHSVRGADTDPYLGRALPVWHSVLRGSALAVWLLCFFAALAWGDSAPWLGAAAAAAFALPCLADLWLRLTARSAARNGGPAAQASFSPSPAPGSGATRRFCETAEIRVHPTDLVLVDSLGQERWLPRTGAHAPERLVRVLDAGKGVPVGAELRTRSGQVRAALPWAPWFGGPDGEARWTEFGPAAGLSVEDRTDGARKGSASWPAHGLARGDAEAMGPLDATTARTGSDFVLTVLGDKNLFILPGFGVATLGIGLKLLGADPAAGLVTTALAALALCASLGPTLAHQLNSRLRLDRPAPGQEATS